MRSGIVTVDDVQEMGDDFDGVYTLKSKDYVVTLDVWHHENNKWAKQWIVHKYDEAYDAGIIPIQSDMMVLTFNFTCEDVDELIETDTPGLYEHQGQRWTYVHPDISQIWTWYWLGGREIYQQMKEKNEKRAGP